MININLKSEYIFSLFGLNITNTFFTSIFVTFFVIFCSFLFFINKNNSESLYIIAIKILIKKIYLFINSIIKNEQKSFAVLPIVTTFFIFILSANLIALLPGFLGSVIIRIGNEEIPLLRSPNSDLTATFALAIVSVLFIQLLSLKSLGIKGFLKRFINFSNPIKFILGFFEIISESVKVLSFSFRLFGNVFAGEVLLLIVAFMVPFFLPLPFMIMEVFVGFIQASIFALLTLTFMQIGMESKE